jgi:hypothetical protein
MPTKTQTVKKQTIRKPATRKPATRQKAAAAEPDISAGFGASALPYSLTAEGQAEAAAARDPFLIGVDVHVISDEWHGKLVEGKPYDDTAQPFKDANPDKHFRYLSDAQCRQRGKREYLPVYDAAGKPVEVSGDKLHWIPKHVHEHRIGRYTAEDKKRRDQVKSLQSTVMNRLAAQSEGAANPLDELDFIGGKQMGAHESIGPLVTE